MIVLPWPDRKLHPNARAHWAAKAREAKRHRKDAYWLAMASGYRPFPCGPLDVQITFHPPDKRRRDVDGMLAACKSLLDGIADYIKVDDHHWRLSLSVADPVPNGAVHVTITQPELACIGGPNEGTK